MDETYACSMHFDEPDVHLSQVVGQTRNDGMELISIKLVDQEGASVFHSFPIPVALAIAHKMMVLGMESQAVGLRT